MPDKEGRNIYLSSTSRAYIRLRKRHSPDVGLSSAPGMTPVASSIFSEVQTA
jgi:hypothetical protein